MKSTVEMDTNGRAAIDEFRKAEYVRHNQRRLEHLASLHLPIAGASVLEVGAGIGDHTGFYLDRGCTVLVTEGREENLNVVRERFAGNPRVRVEELDLERPTEGWTGGASGRSAEKFGVVHCYGVLYHLSDPEKAIRLIASRTEAQKGFAVVETCVSFGPGAELREVREDQGNPSQAISGTGCRPTRGWVYSALRRWFGHVYSTVTQPAHEEFPVDWTRSDARPLVRAVFVCAHRPVVSGLLVEGLPARQVAA